MRFKKPCRRCEEDFRPKGRNHYICNKCSKKVKNNANKKRLKTWEKKRSKKEDLLK